MSDIDDVMRRMKADGITINVTTAAGSENGFDERPGGLIAAAAKRHGIYYEKGE